MKTLPRLAMTVAAATLAIASVPAQAGTRASSSPVSISVVEGEGAYAEDGSLLPGRASLGWLIIVLAVATAAFAAAAGGGSDGGTRSRG